tara:strand:- start:308 stop:643 length:336 start_codon:yes stop_codon:yes gene_type:complete
MTKTLILVIFSMFSLSLLAQKNVQSASIKTTAVCEMCEDLIINKTLAFEKGIKFAEMDVKTGLLEVRYRTDKTSLDHIRFVISQLGYSADSIKADPKAYEALHSCCKSKCE